MAKGGFKRMLKIDDNNYIIDHRPLVHEDCKKGKWICVDVPKDIKFTLNDMILAKAIKLINGKIHWPEKLIFPKCDKFTEMDVILHALKKKLTKAEIEKARRELRIKMAEVSK